MAKTSSSNEVRKGYRRRKMKYPDIGIIKKRGRKRPSIGSPLAEGRVYGSVTQEVTSNENAEAISDNVLQQGHGTNLNKDQQKVDEIIHAMAENIQRALTRGEHIDKLEEGTEGLVYNARKIPEKSRKLRHKYWWKNFNFFVLLSIIVSLIVIAVLFILSK